jgi:hypothetical protein
MKVISEETWMKAAKRGFRNPNAAKPTPMLSTTSVPTKFCMIVRRQVRARLSLANCYCAHCSSEFPGHSPNSATAQINRVTSYMASVYLIDFKRALRIGEVQGCSRQLSLHSASAIRNKRINAWKKKDPHEKRGSFHFSSDKKLFYCRASIKRVIVRFNSLSERRNSSILLMECSTVV